MSFSEQTLFLMRDSTDVLRDMKQLGTTIAILFLGAVNTVAAVGGATTAPPTHPIPAPIKPVTQTYFGTTLVDNYRWMEAKPEPEFRTYLEDQNDYARKVLSRIPGRDKLESDIAALGGMRTVVLTVAPTAGKFFYLKRAPGSQSSKLYVSDPSTGIETLIVDPETPWARDHPIAIDQYVTSNDGKFIAYTVSAGGSENSVLHIREIATAKDLPDVIDRATVAT
jgi:prolyl oligopeptidase